MKVDPRRNNMATSQSLEGTALNGRPYQRKGELGALISLSVAVGMMVGAIATLWMWTVESERADPRGSVSAPVKLPELSGQSSTRAPLQTSI
jgi:hypothetical protein